MKKTKIEMTKTEKLERHDRIILILEKTKTMFDILLLGDENKEEKWKQIQNLDIYMPESHLLLNFCTLMLNIRVNTEPEMLQNLETFYHEVADGIRDNEYEVANMLARFTKTYMKSMKK